MLIRLPLKRHGTPIFGRDIVARVRCVMMQRNEHLLLEAWFRYYGYLFGFENLDMLTTAPPMKA